MKDRDIEDNQPLKSVNTDAVNDCKAQLQQPGRRSFGLVSEQKRIIAELKGELKQVHWIECKRTTFLNKYGSNWRKRNR